MGRKPGTSTKAEQRCRACASSLVLELSKELGECEGCRHERYYKNSH